jgi:hypothetical protein
VIEAFWPEPALGQSFGHRASAQRRVRQDDHLHAVALGLAKRFCRMRKYIPAVVKHSVHVDQEGVVA